MMILAFDGLNTFLLKAKLMHRCFLCFCEEHDFRARFFLASLLAAAKSVGELVPEPWRKEAWSTGPLLTVETTRCSYSLDLISRRKFGRK